MEKIKELEKKLKCEKCHKVYNYTDWVLIYTVCQHQSCSSCRRIASNYTSNCKCPICSRSTSSTRHWLMEDMLTTLHSYESSIVKNDASGKKLRDEISILKQKVSKFEAPEKYCHKCTECEKSDSEQDLQLCETCHGLKFEDYEDVKKYALCPACAIKKHMRKGHQIVDFFPYFSAYNFSSQSSEINTNSEEFKSARDLLTNTFTHFNALSNNNYDLLTDMAQRSESTKNQVECFEKMKTFIDKSKTIHGEADSDMKNHTTNLEEHLNEMKEWYEKRADNCVDESEIIKLPKPENSTENDTEVTA